MLILSLFTSESVPRYTFRSAGKNGNKGASLYTSMKCYQVARTRRAVYICCYFKAERTAIIVIPFFSSCILFSKESVFVSWIWNGKIFHLYLVPFRFLGFLIRRRNKLFYLHFSILFFDRFPAESRSTLESIGIITWGKVTLFEGRLKSLRQINDCSFFPKKLFDLHCDDQCGLIGFHYLSESRVTICYFDGG